jgi:hypothetical protein
MLLQGDKPTATLTRERASRVLFDADEPIAQAQPELSVNFAYDHNVAQFKELVQSKYPQVVNPAETLAGDTQFGKYFNAETKYEAPAGGTLEKYYNDTNPVPYQAFKPKVLTDFDDFYMGQKSGTDETLMQKIGEVQILEPQISEKETAVESETGTKSYLKLNAKGLIACITFAAVTLLIVLLVIINSIAIGNSGSEIRRYQDENTVLQKQLGEAVKNRDVTYKKAVDSINTVAGIKLPYQTLPPSVSYPSSSASPDASTNFFDQLARFFGSLFG